MCKLPVLKIAVRSLAAALVVFGTVGCCSHMCRVPSVPGLYGCVVHQSKRALPISQGEKGSILVVFRGDKRPSTHWSVDPSSHPPAEEEFHVISPPAQHEEYAVTNFAATKHELYFIDPKNRDQKRARGIFVPPPTKIKVSADMTTIVEIEYKPWPF